MRRWPELPAKTEETVDADTPASFATSCNVDLDRGFVGGVSFMIPV
jgi:hypothetical protein